MLLRIHLLSEKIVEICKKYNIEITGNVFLKSADEIEKIVEVCKKYNIEVNERTVLCHSEAYKLGLASNHADVMHWFPKYGKDMNTFRKDVINMLNTNNTEVRYKTLEDIPNYGKATIKKLIDKGYLSGTNSDNGLDISKDMLRVFIINDRAGLYDR